MSQLVISANQDLYVNSPLILGARHLNTSPTQGPGKVGARSGQKARFGQGLGRQGLGKVGARSGQASCEPNVFYSYHSPESISGLYH